MILRGNAMIFQYLWLTLLAKKSTDVRLGEGTADDGVGPHQITVVYGKFILIFFSSKCAVVPPYSSV